MPRRRTGPAVLATHGTGEASDFSGLELLQGKPKPKARQAAVAISFAVILRPEPGIDPIRAVRAGLKTLLRRHGLRAIDVREVSL